MSVGDAVVVGVVGVEEGGEVEDGGGGEAVEPGEGGEGVGFVLVVAEAGGVVLEVFEAGGVGVVGDLEVVGAELGDEAELVGGGAVEDQRGEAAEAAGGVVKDLPAMGVERP